MNIGKKGLRSKDTNVLVGDLIFLTMEKFVFVARMKTIKLLTG